jgi:hypothetical protein
MTSANKLRAAMRKPDLLDPPPCKGVVLAVLCGGRPNLLARTLESLRNHTANRGFDIVGVAMLNSRDEHSEEILNQHAFRKVYLAKNGAANAVVPIGPAVTGLMVRAAAIAEEVGLPWILHLEDDWNCCADSQWVHAAAHYLGNPRVGQVRLRWYSEPVMNNHCITGNRIGWIRANEHWISGNAHYTFNPNMIRAVDVPRIFGCDATPVAGERGAQMNFDALGLRVVQLDPGAFAHIGGEDSLRGSMHRGHDQ